MADSQDQFELDVPGALGEALRGAYRARMEIPARVDDAVIAAARGKFDRRRRLKLLARWGAAASTVAAAVLVVIWVGSRRDPNVPVPVAKVVKGDVDGSGRVDIVDAMMLARHLKAGDATEAAWDANGDAKVDQRDVDAVAAAAVSLKQAGVAQRSLPTMDELGLARVPKMVDVAPRDVAVMNVRREAGQ